MPLTSAVFGNDTAFAVALDPAGNVYLTGTNANRANFPVLQALQTTNSQSDAFVVKLNASSQVLYSTYLGARGRVPEPGIAADAVGTPMWPGTPPRRTSRFTSGAYQPDNPAAMDAFVAQIERHMAAPSER